MSNWIASLHVAFAAAAILLGSGIFVARRGTPLHRKLGYAYITSMLTLNISALLLYSRTGDSSASGRGALPMHDLDHGWRRGKCGKTP